ncbi:endonuclease, partial [Escherichia coli]|nr:endonuclease [Escherichia coli]
MIEVWVDIEGIPFYQVSNKGNFRSITREVTVTSTRQRPYKKIINGTSVKPFKCKSTGYLQIKVYGKKYSAHRIVAKAFCTGFCDGLVVNHKNGRRDDNRADNLEW